MELSFKKYGDHPNKTLIILHGLFGMLDNWQLQARKASEYASVYTLDLRNHGRSPHSEEMSYGAMAEDIYSFCELHNIKKPIILGHSMGGKVAMQTALDYPDLPQKLVVADIAPKAYLPGHLRYFEALNRIDFSKIENRAMADRALKEYESNDAIRLFLLKNLEKAESGYRLKMNLAAIERSYDHIIGGIPIPYPISIPTLFMKGSRSSYISDEDEAELALLFPESKLVEVPNAGHWLHAENPEGFFNALYSFIEK